MKQNKRGLALLVWAVLLARIFAAPALAAENEFLPRQEHMELSLEELEQLPISMDTFTETAAEVLALCGEAENLTKTAEKLLELRTLYQQMDTELSLASIHCDRNAADTAASEEYLSLLKRSYDVEQWMDDVLQAVRNSPCAGAVDPNDVVLSMFGWGSAPMTEEEEALFLEEEALIDRYYAAAQQTWTVEADGKVYTEDEAFEAYLRDELSWEQYDELALQAAQRQNEALAELYVELVQNRARQAELYGYTDYAALEDDAVFYRDYTRGEISVFSKAVKTHIVPLLSELNERISACAAEGAYARQFTEDELLEYLRAGIADISEEMLPALDYMTEYGYYDISASAAKSELAFTTFLYYPNAPFLFMQPEGGPQDFSTIVHEFGHYNAYFCSGDPYAANYDLSEIHSQGLELLMLREYDSVFGESAPAMELWTLYALLASLVDGCMMDELERYAYSAPDLTVESLNRKYMQLLKDYGYRDQDDPAEQAYGWVMTGHLYSSPLYYISYAVSAAGAFQIWEQSLNDWDGAVDTYLRLVALGESGYFFPSLRQVGMENPITEGSVADLAALLREQVLSVPVFSQQAPEDTEQNGTAGEAAAGAGTEEMPYKTAILLIMCIFVALDVIIVTVIVVVRRKEKRG